VTYGTWGARPHHHLSSEGVGWGQKWWQKWRFQHGEWRSSGREHRLSAQEGRGEDTAAGHEENLEGEDVGGSHRLHRRSGKVEVVMEFPSAV
jgi:hypothetical protein